MAQGSCQAWVSNPDSGGKGDGGEQDLVLGFEPGQGLLEDRRAAPGAAPGLGGARATGSLCRVQQRGAVRGGVQVVVEHPASGLARVRRRCRLARACSAA